MSLETASRGLTSAEAAARLERDGPNRLVPDERGHRIRRALGPLADPMVALLLVAAPTYLLIGETTDAVIAMVALGPIIAVGWLLEARAERTLDRLKALTARAATVVRDGEVRQVPADELVVGDVVQLHEGDVVPADGVLLELTQLMVDESALTGESLPLAKAITDGADGLVLAGTTVLSGRAVARITVVGGATQYGQIGSLLSTVRTSQTPLQRGLGRLVLWLSVVAAVFCVLVMAAELYYGHGWGQAVIAGVSLAIAAIPEEFSMVYTLYLALGAWRLAKANALVRRLPSVETLGSTTVICTDKTGTLTHGRLAVASCWTASGSEADERELLATAVLACEPDPFDPLDVAIVDHASRAGVDVDELHRGTLVADWAFDPVDKYLVHAWQHEGPGHAVAVKGSVEGVLRHASPPEELHRSVVAANTALADDGMRVIAVAGCRTDASVGVDRTDDERGLVFLGLVAFSDPVREHVADALSMCRGAGIRVIMITGDHPATAHAIAEGLDLPHDANGVDLIATGDDIDHADETELDRLVADANVFARTRPEQKHQLVQALRRRGEVVAMTGDGINDAPALREADIGVAMGERGTEVAREAAALVLLDDNFATIVGAVRDGRRIFDNLIRAFAYLIAFHPPLLFAAMLVPLIGRPLLLLPVHLVLLEILLHPVVSLVFQADPADDDVMDRPPRPVGDALRLRALWRPYAVGTALAAGIITEYLVALGADWTVGEARALAFATLLSAQPFLLLGMRSPHRPMWRSGRPWTPALWWVTAMLVVTTLGVVLVPPVARLLQLEAFEPWAWSIVVSVAAITTTWAEPFKRRS
jgi:Ca2+-transporting ATPase